MPSLLSMIVYLLQNAKFATTVVQSASNNLKLLDIAKQNWSVCQSVFVKYFFFDRFQISTPTGEFWCLPLNFAVVLSFNYTFFYFSVL